MSIFNVFLSSYLITLAACVSPYISYNVTLFDPIPVDSLRPKVVAKYGGVDFDFDQKHLGIRHVETWEIKANETDLDNTQNSKSLPKSVASITLSTTTSSKSDEFSSNSLTYLAAENDDKELAVEGTHLLIKFDEHEEKEEVVSIRKRDEKLQQVCHYLRSLVTFKASTINCIDDTQESSITKSAPIHPLLRNQYPTRMFCDQFYSFTDESDLFDFDANAPIDAQIMENTQKMMKRIIITRDNRSGHVRVEKMVLGVLTHNGVTAVKDIMSGMQDKDGTEISILKETKESLQLIRFTSSDKKSPSPTTLSLSSRHQNHWSITAQRFFSSDPPSFHPTVIYNISAYSLSSASSNAKCNAIIQQYIPPSMFVDTYQVSMRLSDMSKFGEEAEMLRMEVFGFVELEKPVSSRESKAMIVRMGLELPHEGNLNRLIELPLHLRYQPPVSNGIPFLIHIPPAQLFVSCPVNAPDRPESLLSDYFKQSVSTFPSMLWYSNFETVSDELVVSVPRGNLEDAQFVEVITMGVTWLGCLIGCWVVFQKWWNLPTGRSEQNRAKED
ncbi:PIG-X [Paraphysoderma sedebokerense]|nr:PIG-X [Paraphysoderma sedebokerense]